MKILMISHTIKENTDKMLGRCSIIPYYLREQGHKVKHVLRNEWFYFLREYHKFNPDVIITVGPIGAFVAFMKNIGIIRKPIVHDWNDNYSEVFRGKIKRRIAGILERYAVGNSDLVITSSLYRLKKGIYWGIIKDKEIIYLPHGVKDYFLKNSAKAKLPGKNKLKLVYAGEVSKGKRVDYLINEIKGKDIDLIILGKADESIKKQSSSNIYFLGQIGSEKVPGYLKSADFLVITENNDSALKLMEYLAMNKPILAPKGRISYIKGNYNQILFYDNFSNVYNIIRKYKKKVFKNNIEGWENIVKKYINEIKKIIK